jgi:hypothetical protein
VASLSTVSGVSNGSTLTYLFGADEKTGLVGKADIAAALLLIVEAYAFATGGIQDNVYDFDLGHWGFERQPRESLADFLLRLSESRFLAGKDNVCFSLTPQGAYADNAAWQSYSGTYYFSYITAQTEKGWLSSHHYPQPRMNPAMLPHGPTSAASSSRASRFPYRDFARRTGGRATARYRRTRRSTRTFPARTRWASSSTPKRRQVVSSRVPGTTSGRATSITSTSVSSHKPTSSAGRGSSTLTCLPGWRRSRWAEVLAPTEK